MRGSADEGGETAAALPVAGGRNASSANAHARTGGRELFTGSSVPCHPPASLRFSASKSQVFRHLRKRSALWFGTPQVMAVARDALRTKDPIPIAVRPEKGQGGMALPLAASLLLFPPPATRENARRRATGQLHPRCEASWPTTRGCSETSFADPTASYQQAGNRLKS